MLKLQYVGRGMHLEFRHPQYPTPIITSPIQEIRDCRIGPTLELRLPASRRSLVARVAPSCSRDLRVNVLVLLSSH